MKMCMSPGAVVSIALAFAAAACSASSGSTKQGGGGAAGSTLVLGGASGKSGGSAGTGTSGTGGSAGLPGSGGGTAAGGAASTGGALATGGVAGGAPQGTGGTSSAGGAMNAGGAPGGSTGAATTGAGGAGGTTSGGGSAGTAGATGGASGSGGSAAFSASYLIGADVSFAESASGGSQDDLLAQLAAHGFNAIRLRTFVDPKAADGYDQTNGTCDIDHTVAFGKKVKSLGMFLFVDFHYSDNWADPGKQCVPVAWQKYASIADLATAVHDYTKDSIGKLIAGGARPDMVQIGNETTPGMLLHVCDSGGLPTGENRVTGSTSNWGNLGALFKAGIKGVKDVDAGILTALHIDRGGDKPSDTSGAALSLSKGYIDSALKQGVTFDVFGESCYQQYQGDPGSTTKTKQGWTSTLGGLAAAYPAIKILAAEYGPMQREINDVVFGLGNKQGLGTFNWEPEKGGDWNTGHLLFYWDNDKFTAQPDLLLYDQMKTAYASRL
jgi:arabinogalactan endo-1,4-beta-galactosidase